jgi:neutral ceramidase
MCWCGQMTAEGPVADRAAFGMAEFTGSEEGRGPLFDVTRVPFEGDHLPVGVGPQGDKAAAPIPLDIPKAVPLMALRVGSRMIVSIPGEMTAEMGRRVRAAVLGATAGSGVERAVISGLANEYADYFTTPEEYDAQHYEGAATVYGRASSLALQQVLVDLTGDLVGGRPAPAPYAYDPRNGVNADAAPFSPGAGSGSAVAQPADARRLGHPTFSWQGGPRGLDRPLDRAFVVLQRLSPDAQAAGGQSWRSVDSDLGLDVLWTVDDDGVYRAEWEPRLNAALGSYRFLVTANRYRLTSSPFSLRPSTALSIHRLSSAPGTVAIELDYPAAVSHEAVGDPAGDSTADLTYRPAAARGGSVTFLVNGRQVTVQSSSNVFTVPANPGDQIVVAPGAAVDLFGNRNGTGLSFSA